MKRFRGGLVFKAHRLLFHSTLGLRVIKKKRSYRLDLLIEVVEVRLEQRADDRDDAAQHAVVLFEHEEQLVEVRLELLFLRFA